MDFKMWMESQIVSYSNKPIVAYITPQLASNIEKFHLPKWQQDERFLRMVKYFIDNEGDELIQKDPQRFEQFVIRFASSAANQRRDELSRKAKQNNPNLETTRMTYERCSPGDTFERIVCGKNLRLEKVGMKAHSLVDTLNDPELKGYYGVHVGDADRWLDWLVDDGYCSGDIYIYTITIPPKPVFYVAEDANSGGWAGEFVDKQVPDGQIIFSNLQTLPARSIKLDNFIKEAEYWKRRRQSGL